MTDCKPGLVESGRPFLYGLLVNRNTEGTVIFMKTASAKIFLIKAIKGLGIALSVIILLTVILAAGTYSYNSVSLKKEAALIEHKGQYVEVDGHRMNIYAAGNGEKTLVFMAGSGVPAPILEFRPLAEILGKKYQTVIIEKFGYGYSDEIDGERTVGIITENDREALKTAGIEGPYILCPHSASGFEALWWANKYPEEVEAIIGLDMAVPEEYDYMGVDWNTLTPMDPEQWADDNRLYDFWLYKIGLMRYMNAQEIFPPSGSDELTKEEKNEYKALMYTKYALGSSAAMNHEQWTTQRQIDEMKELCDASVPNIPTLLFVSNGKYLAQMVGKPENWILIHKNYISNISEGRLIELDCGHWVHLDEKDRVSEEMISFIDTLNAEEQ